MSTIRTEHLYKVFGNRAQEAVELLESGVPRDEVRERTGALGAVNDANVEVGEGEVFVVMGLSGSGKSTLVRMLNRLIEPTAGTVELDGRNVMDLGDEELRELRAGTISMVFQRFALFPHLSVLENTAWGLEVQHLAVEERHRRARAALETVGLEGWDTHTPAQLSGGMQQRVGLARALATDADILLMDEPFSALDPLIKRDMQTLLLNLQREIRKTIVFITHDLNEAMRLGDRIAVMKDGWIEQTGTPDEILSDPATAYVAEFVRDVDRSRVLTAASIMVDPVATLAPRLQPRAAMLEFKEAQATELYVADHDGRLHGLVSDRDVHAASERGDATIEGAVHQDYPRAAPDTIIGQTLLDAAEHTVPIAVVDDGRLVGVIPRVSLLGALASGDGDEGGEEFSAAGLLGTEPAGTDGDAEQRDGMTAGSGGGSDDV